MISLFNNNFLEMFWEQFYPTPKHIIDKMLNKVDFNSTSVKNILEPSAWKWDIINWIKNKYWYSKSSKNIYCCEIDYNLRKILKDDFNSIIWFDFLELNWNYLQFDTIIMNPPFDNGVKHFMKAWNILDKWIIVCLLNEETIKNPYSEERKTLLKIIEDNNWEVEYLWSCFAGSERDTNVRVAMITIKKESWKFESIFEWFQKDFLNAYSNLDWEIIENEIVVWTDKVDHLIRVNEIMKRESVKYIVATARLWHYKSIFWNANNDTYLSFLKDYKVEFKDIKSEINKSIFEINRQSWYSFFRDTNIREKMTDKVYKDFIDEYQNSCIDFNKENIWVVVDIIMAMQWKIYEQSVVDIFDEFTKYHEENRVYFEWWKTNQAWKVWKRVILPRYLRASRSWDKVMADFWARQKLFDIDKVMANLKWIDIKKVRTIESILEKEIVTWEWYESTFFKIKWYKKLTLHLEFIDQELLKQFNYIVCSAKKWLPPNK